MRPPRGGKRGGQSNKRKWSMSKRPFMDFYRFHRMSLNRHSLLLRRTHRGSVRMPCRLLDWTISRVMVSGRLRRTAEVRGNFYSSLATITECLLTRSHFAWECEEVMILYCVMLQYQNELSAMPPMILTQRTTLRDACVGGLRCEARPQLPPAASRRGQTYSE